MIRVDRNRVQAPTILTGSGSRGARETKRVADFIANPPPPPPKGAKPIKRPKFTTYSDRQVIQAITGLFGDKCAYCESRYAATQPVDVEHYRPKGGVAEAPAHTGYYWLGAAWENLLPSCIDCNREREQTIVGGPAPLTAKAGKACAFPLLDETKRALTPADPLDREEPLLLNPCRDDPAQFLRFSTDAVLLPARSDPSPELERARASIRVFGLNRSGLVVSRLETLRLLQARFLTITRLAAALDACGTGRKKLADMIEDLLAHECSEMRAFAHPARPYSLMCTQLIDAFMQRYQPAPPPSP